MQKDIIKIDDNKSEIIGDDKKKLALIYANKGFSDIEISSTIGITNSQFSNLVLEDKDFRESLIDIRRGNLSNLEYELSQACNTRVVKKRTVKLNIDPVTNEILNKVEVINEDEVLPSAAQILNVMRYMDEKNKYNEDGSLKNVTPQNTIFSLNKIDMSGERNSEEDKDSDNLKNKIEKDEQKDISLNEIVPTI